MAAERHLSHAPIEEAVIELRVTPREGRRIEELEELCAKLSSTYPTKLLNRQFVAEVEVKVGGPSKTASNQWLQGFRIESEPKAKVVQFNADLFSFSWLRPYSKWDEFVAEARRNWELYETAWAPISITRVGTRFINRIILPSERLDFDDYFTAFPRIPPSLPQSLVTFFSRVVIPYDEGRTTTTVSLAMEDRIGPGSVSVLLDVDVARESPHLGTPGMTWQLIDSFRDLKNKAFFGSLTDKAIEMYR